MGVRFLTRSRPSVGIAFAESILVAARNGSGPRVLARELPDGLLKPSKVTPNVQSVSELARVAEELLSELGARRGTAAVILPDLSVTTAVFRGEERGSERLLRERLGAKLSFPVSEARLDFWRGEREEVLGAAVRETVARQYEQVVEAVDFRIGPVDGASLTKIPGWARAAAGRPGICAQLQLYRSHYFLSVFDRGELVDIRTKLRSPGDVAAVAGELLRLPAVVGEALGSLTLVGEDATAVAARIAGQEGIREVLVEEDGEERQLASTVLARLTNG